MKAFHRILLAEDDRFDQGVTLKALAQCQLASITDVVSDGAEALDYLLQRGPYQDRANSPPVLVILDIKMHKLDGIEVLREMRRHPALRRVPVVMLTSSREEPDLAASYEAGANAYVVKPVEYRAFVDAVKAIATFWVNFNQTAAPDSRAETSSPPAA